MGECDYYNGCEMDPHVRWTLTYKWLVKYYKTSIFDDIYDACHFTPIQSLEILLMLEDEQFYRFLKKKKAWNEEYESVRSQLISVFEYSVTTNTYVRYRYG